MRQTQAEIIHPEPNRLPTAKHQLTNVGHQPTIDYLTITLLQANLAMETHRKKKDFQLCFPFIPARGCKQRGGKNCETDTIYGRKRNLLARSLREIFAQHFYRDCVGNLFARTLFRRKEKKHKTSNVGKAGPREPWNSPRAQNGSHTQTTLAKIFGTTRRILFEWHLHARRQIWQAKPPKTNSEDRLLR